MKANHCIEKELQTKNFCCRVVDSNTLKKFIVDCESLGNRVVFSFVDDAVYAYIYRPETEEEEKIRLKHEAEKARREQEELLNQIKINIKRLKEHGHEIGIDFIKKVL